MNIFLVPWPVYRKIFIAISIATFLLSAFIMMSDANAASPGDKVYKKCKACHSLEEGKNKMGPSLYGLADRKAGTVAKYRYSKALKASDIVWDKDTLDKWLTNPKKMVPGTKMNTKLKKAKDRTAIVEYLLKK